VCLLLSYATFRFVERPAMARRAGPAVLVAETVEV
jgi:hypothetical protein